VQKLYCKDIETKSLGKQGQQHTTRKREKVIIQAPNLSKAVDHRSQITLVKVNCPFNVSIPHEMEHPL
jgi:hypothetical protein